MNTSELTLLSKTDDAVYRGDYQGKEAIYKFTNGETRQAECLKVIGKPELYHHTTQDVVVPDGDRYQTLTIEEYIPGLALRGEGTIHHHEGVGFYYQADFVTYDQIPVEMRKPLFVAILKESQRIEALGIVRQGFLDKTIISKDWMDGKIGTVTFFDYRWAGAPKEANHTDRLTHFEMFDYLLDLPAQAYPEGYRHFTHQDMLAYLESV